MNKDETILEIMKDYPTQKIGLDDFYGRQTVINMLEAAINYTRCSSDVVCGCYRPNIDNTTQPPKKK